jgi:hypothetical protein
MIRNNLTQLYVSNAPILRSHPRHTPIQGMTGEAGFAQRCSYSRTCDPISPFPLVAIRIYAKRARLRPHPVKIHRKIGKTSKKRT